MQKAASLAVVGMPMRLMLPPPLPMLLLLPSLCREFRIYDRPMPDEEFVAACTAMDVKYRAM